MPQPNRAGLRSRLGASARRTLSMAVFLLPVLIGVVLLTGLLLELLPAERMAELPAGLLLERLIDGRPAPHRGNKPPPARSGG